MARTKTTKSVETAAPVVVESVVAAPVAASAPVVKKSAKKPKTSHAQSRGIKQYKNHRRRKSWFNFCWQNN